VVRQGQHGRLVQVIHVGDRIEAQVGGRDVAAAAEGIAHCADREQRSRQRQVVAAEGVPGIRGPADAADLALRVGDAGVDALEQA
nr:hypothetical protein [Tanacetum cinerariifolium]